MGLDHIAANSGSTLSAVQPSADLAARIAKARAATGGRAEAAPAQDRARDAAIPAPRFSADVEGFLRGAVAVSKMLREGGQELPRAIMADGAILDRSAYVPREHVRGPGHPSKVYEARGFNAEETEGQAIDVSRRGLELVAKLARSVAAYNQNLAVMNRIDALNAEVGAGEYGYSKKSFETANALLRREIDAAVNGLSRNYGASGALIESGEGGTLALKDFSVAADGAGWSATIWSDGTVKTFMNGSDITSKVASENPLYGFKFGEPGTTLDVSA